MPFPFLAALPAIGGAIGSIFGKAAGGKSDQRQQENYTLAQQNRTLADLFQTQQNAQMQQGQQDLLRKAFTEQARGGRAKQALLADVLGNMQDVNVSVPGIRNATITGGLRPSAIGPQGRQALSEMAKQALLAQMTPDTFQGGNILPPPQFAPMKQPSGFEKFLNIAGLVGSGIGGVGAALQALQKPKYSVLEGPDHGSGEGSD